jgi:hypothetical protein
MDTGWRYERVGGKERRSLSGTNTTSITITNRRGRSISWTELADHKAFPKTGSTNEDFEQFWTEIDGCDPIRLCEDYSELASTGSQNCFMSGADDLAKVLKRLHVDIETYGMTLDFDRKES